MKVALVCDWYHPRVGGIELHLHDLARRLLLAGHEPIVVTPTPGPDRVDDIQVRRVVAPLAPGFGFLCTPAGIRALDDVIADERPDVVHAHVSIISPAALGGARKASGRGVPTAVTFHSFVPATRALARASRALLGARWWRAAYSAVSDRVAREVRPFAGDEPVAVLPNGIDVSFWKTDPPAVRAARLELVSVMRLNAKKRPFVLLDTMDRLERLLPRELPVRLRIIGDGPLRSRLARAIEQRGFRDLVELCGALPRADIRTVFAESDVFILPTERESFGLAALEARCAGLPVVAMASSAIAEFVHHGREGLLAHSDAELAVHVATLARDVERRRTMSEHNRRTAPPFDWPRVVDAHMAVYRDAIALRDQACADK